MLEIVHTDLRSPSTPTCRLPRRVVHRSHPTVTKQEHILRVLTTDAVDDGLGHLVQHDEPFLSVLHLTPRDDEHTGLELFDYHFPFPLQTTDFLIATSGVDLKQRHTRQMARQLLEQPGLLIP